MTKKEIDEIFSLWFKIEKSHCNIQDIDFCDIFYTYCNRNIILNDWEWYDETEIITLEIDNEFLEFKHKEFLSAQEQFIFWFINKVEEKIKKN